MLRVVLISILMLTSTLSEAQEIQGSVIEAKTYAGIGDVLIANKRTSESTYSDSLGKYRINAIEGDLLFFYRLGYYSRRETAHIAQQTIGPVAMFGSGVALDEVQVKGNVYKIDSIERSIIYGRGLREARKVVYVRLGNGITFYNLPSQLAKRLTGQLKREKHFLKQFEEGEKEKFVATRYNLSTVNKVTGLSGDEAGIFLNAHPMPYDFARAATEMELLSWIKNSYRQYLNKRKGRP